MTAITLSDLSPLGGYKDGLGRDLWRFIRERRIHNSFVEWLPLWPKSETPPPTFFSSVLPQITSFRLPAGLRRWHLFSSIVLVKAAARHTWNATKVFAYKIIVGDGKKALHRARVVSTFSGSITWSSRISSPKRNSTSTPKQSFALDNCSKIEKKIPPSRW